MKSKYLNITKQPSLVSISMKSIKNHFVVLWVISSLVSLSYAETPQDKPIQKSSITQPDTSKDHPSVSSSADSSKNSKSSPSSSHQKQKTQPKQNAKKSSGDEQTSKQLRPKRPRLDKKTKKAKRESQLPTFIVGGSCDVLNQLTDRDFSETLVSGCGIFTEVSLKKPSKNDPHRIMFSLSWRGLGQTNYLFDRELKLDRDLIDLGVSYHYQIIEPALNIYTALSVGVAFDELCLETEDPLIGNQDWVLHGAGSLGLELLLHGGGLRVFYSIEYLAGSPWELRVATEPPGVTTLNLGELNHLFHGARIAAFLQF